LSTRKVYHCEYVDEQGRKHPVNGYMSDILLHDNKVYAANTYGEVWQWQADLHDADCMLFKPLELPLSSPVIKMYPYGGCGQMLVLTKESLALVDLSDKRVLAETPVSNITKADNSGHYTLYYSSRMDAVIIGAGIGSSTYAYRFSDGEFRVLDIDLPNEVKDVIDYDGATYFATDGGGLVRWESETSSVAFTPSNSTLSGFAVHSLFIDSDNNLWIGTYRNGLNLLSPYLDKVATYNMKNGMLCHNVVSAVYVHDNKIYAGLDGGGFAIIDTKTNTSRSITSSNSDLPGDNVVGMTGEGKNIWLGIYRHGLYRYDIESDKLNYIDLDSLGANQRKDVLWELWNDGKGHIIAQGERVNVFDAKTGALLDSSYAGTNPTDALMKKLADDPDLKGYECLCAYSDSVGKCYVGTTKGLVCFAPKKLYHSPHHVVRFEQASISYDSLPIDLGGKSQTELLLPHNSNRITVQFSIPQIIYGKQAVFKYRILGYEDEYKELQGSRNLTFGPLPPGVFTLEITPVSNNASIDAVCSTLSIKVMRPWYATWWAYLLWLAIFVAVAVTIYYIYRHRKTMESEISLQQEQRIQTEQKYKEAAQQQREAEEERERVLRLLRQGIASEDGLSPEDSKFINECKECISQNLRNPDLSVDFIASELNMSHSALYKRVKTITGHSVVDLIIDSRLSRAIELIRSGVGNMTEVADSCGFNDLRSFRATFKSRMGMSPKQYAKEL
jgi:AraC-like DNA-binding protein